MDTLAILVAAGRGERLGAGQPKAFLELHGQSLLLRSALALERAPSVDGIVAVVPADRITESRGMLAPVSKLHRVVAGGPHRQDSVREGLSAAPEGFAGLVLIHDAARPLVTVELIEAVAGAARESGAALPTLALTDTIKKIRDGHVERTLDRSGLFAAQTPQAFRYPLLVRACREAAARGLTLTDEAMAVEELGEAVRAVPGSPRNRKITDREDLAWAEELLRREER